MRVLALFAMFSLSSLTLAALATRSGRPEGGAIRRAGQAIIGFTGLWATCLALNLTLGIVLILGLRVTTRIFVSIYILNDISVVILAALQAVAVQAWRGRDLAHSSQRPDPHRSMGAS